MEGVEPDKEVRCQSVAFGFRPRENTHFSDRGSDLSYMGAVIDMLKREDGSSAVKKKRCRIHRGKNK